MLAKMIKEASSARRADRLANQGAEKDTFIHGAKAKQENFHQVQLKQVLELRDMFKGVILRRTTRPKDRDGEYISGLEPYHDHELVLTPYEWERKHLDKMAGLATRLFGWSGFLTTKVIFPPDLCL